MAYRCDLCAKSKMIGRKHRHHKGVAGGKWLQRAQKTLKVSRPNLHNFNGFLNGKKGKYLLCTKCLRKVKANQPKPKIKKEVLPADNPPKTASK
jgi:ribosomal protein L28